MYRFALAIGLTTFVVLGNSRLSLGDIIFNGFANTTGLSMNGSTITTTTQDGVVLRLTQSIPNHQSGSAFAMTRQSTAGFMTVFSFRIGGNGGSVPDPNLQGADGIAFVIQNQTSSLLGADQGQLGYGGMQSSLAIEYDTWQNLPFNDPSRSHVGIMLNGNANHSAAGQGPTANIGNTNAATTALPGPELDANVRWWSWIQYDGTTMRMYLEQNNSTIEPLLPVAPILTFQVDLASIVGNNEAFVGFTSSTGGMWSNHDIIYWRHTAIPEPSSLMLLFGSTIGMLLSNRNRRN